MIRIVAMQFCAEFDHTNRKNYVKRIPWTKYNDGTFRRLSEVLEDEKVVSVLLD